jgi:membrane protein YdbS with pleckstrin-like domain
LNRESICETPVVDWRRPSGRLRTLRRVQVAVLALPAAVAAGLALGFGVAAWAGAVGFAVVAAAAGVADVLLGRRVAAWGYAERDEDLLVRRGLLVRRLSVVPYGRMQFVDVVAGPFERAFGLATVRLHTAAAATDARIPGLRAEEAARLRDQLASLGEARAAGL